MVLRNLQLLISIKLMTHLCLTQSMNMSLITLQYQSETRGKVQVSTDNGWFYEYLRSGFGNRMRSLPHKVVYIMFNRSIQWWWHLQFPLKRSCKYIKISSWYVLLYRKYNIFTGLFYFCVCSSIFFYFWNVSGNIRTVSADNRFNDNHLQALHK